MRSTPCLAVILAAITPLVDACRRPDTDASYGPVEVPAVVVSIHAIPETIIASGAIDAVNKADIAFLVAGRVASVEVEDGAQVAKGQLLASLDPSDYGQTLAIAEAKLGEVSSRHARLTRLRELGSLTDADFDKANAALKEAESSAELARRQLGYTELRAPFDGIVVRHGVAAGVVVVPAVPVFTVLAPAPVWANVGIAEADARRVRPGQAAQVCLPAAGGWSHEGHVEAVLPQADPLSWSFTAKIRLENADGLLRPGNVIIAHIMTGASHGAMTIPPGAVQKNPDGSLFVWVVDPARHTAVRQIVEVGALRTTEVEIDSGLRPGDQVVTVIPLTLFEGTPLRVIPAQ
jgi:RND family efflux transporter MFP subunit